MHVLKSILYAISEGSKIPYVDQKSLKEEMSDLLGANFDGLTDEDLTNLGKYTNAAKGPVVTKIWGKLITDRFKALAKEKADYYETPSLADDGTGKEKSDVEGLKALFYELTAYAAGAYTWERLETNLDARLYNWGKKKKEQRFHIMVAGYNTIQRVKKGGETVDVELPFAPASLPKEFANDLFNFFWNIAEELNS